MSLRRLLPLSAAVSGNLRRSLSTAASSHPPWAILDYSSLVDRSSSAPGACFRPVAPPGISSISAPSHLLGSRERPAPYSNVVQLLGGDVRAASGDGYLLLNYLDGQAEAPCTSWDLSEDMEIHRFVCNPVSGQMLRLPDIAGSRSILLQNHMGLLTQADGGRGHGPPDRFAVAELVFDGRALERFLSDEGEWKTVLNSVPSRSLLPRRMQVNQETVAFGGRLWWVDLTLGVVSVDPFGDPPEICGIQLPSGSVLPARAHAESGDFSKAEENVKFMLEVAKYRRVGVSQGRLRYDEITPGGPFLLSSFALDDHASSWKLEQQVELRQVLADGGYQLQHNSPAPQIAVLDPLNAGAVHLKVGEHVVVVDMHNRKVIGASPLQDDYFSLVPCVLPPWLGASRIPTTGKKDDMEAPDDLVICL
ncbi:uncharacterized protein LOC124656296 [Lolium rigidum]|uniref:uncharacterized protein LOC124656296 n=1 Tax=Lolium rigidum TaxID=89674 RepID=UPI001F5DD808|nr:uncharacterized protein LOC124656296 [Lolium rigidum]